MKKTFLTDRISRISWGAIIAGGLTAVAVSLLLGLLGLGIGFSSINPETEANPLSGLGTGSLIWFVLSNLIALFAGGWVAGRTAGFPNKKDGGLHGFLAWGLYTTISFVFLTSTVLGAISGIGSAVSSVFGGNSKEVVVNVEDAKEKTQTGTESTLESIKSKLFSVIEDAEDLNVLPENTSEEVKGKLKKAEVDGKKIVKDLNLDKQIRKFVDNLDYNINDQGELSISAEGDYFDNKSIKEYLTKNTELTEKEIDDLINNWKQEVDNTIQKAEEYYNKAIVKAREYSQAAAEAMAKVALYSFFALLLGLIVAFFGGTLGSPKHIVEAVDENKGFL